MKLKVEISLIKLSDLEGFGRPWIQEGGPFERSSGFCLVRPQKSCNLAAHLHIGRLSADRRNSESLPFSLYSGASL